MLSGNYALTLQGGGEGTQKVSYVGSLLGMCSLTEGAFARGERKPWRAPFSLLFPLPPFFLIKELLG